MAPTGSATKFGDADACVAAACCFDEARLHALAAEHMGYLLNAPTADISPSVLDERLDVTTGWLIQAANGPASRPLHALA
jgi:hypothetical protein